ncbi:ROK family transcriptional regulator [Neobacillus notoginsengisoli]|uniref:ROK family transcriptional regulator n=1 Tax=Neobacillus notoginsengisoli TaxID=1578198 RepID=A0A417YY18_9BACI|nr:ROK family transcriptional regulator [Neobacillus notoginsengisoli]RHW42682.1 ROK family transcriptional regulator [Neobacillus notoginsengisoli]
MTNKFQIGSFQLMKSMNRSLILNIIRRHEPISRSEIAKLTKLTPPTVSNLVKELLQAGIVIEQKLGESSGGRKPTLLTLNGDNFHVVGLDVGSRSIKAIITTITGKLLVKKNFPLPPEVTKEMLLNFLKEAIHTIKQSGHINVDKIIGIGVAMHGIVDIEKGESIFAPNLDLQNIPIKEVLEKEFKMAVKVENDARAMSLGELWFGHGGSYNSFVCVNAGRGIGAGIVINGKLFHGSNCISGEIGHMIIDVNGPKCSCGNFGCLQAFASGPAIAEAVKKRIKMGYSGLISELAGNDPDKVTGELVYEAAKKGDQLCTAALEQAGHYLGIGLTNLIHTLNPDKIIIGGGVSNAQDFVFDAINRTVLQKAVTKPAKNTEILISKFGDDATVMGAVALILVELFSTRTAA